MRVRRPIHFVLARLRPDSPNSIKQYLSGETLAQTVAGLTYCSVWQVVHNPNITATVHSARFSAVEFHIDLEPEDRCLDAVVPREF